MLTLYPKNQYSQVDGKNLKKNLPFYKITSKMRLEYSYVHTACSSFLGHH
jgi:hypothetical protein